MNIEELRALIALADQGQLSLLELKRPAFRLRLEGSMPTAAAAAAAADVNIVSEHGFTSSIDAPGFGFFCSRHPSRNTVLCQDPSQVKAGDVLALIRVDQLYLPVICDLNGSVRKLVADDVLVGYGTPLFELTAV